MDQILLGAEGLSDEALAALFRMSTEGGGLAAAGGGGGDEAKEEANIWVAASDGDSDKVFEFIEGGTSVNAQDEHGYSPIHAVVGYGHEALLRRLLAAGADVSLRDVDGDTPLHVCEHVGCAAILLEAGADVNAKNGDGKTPLQTAEEDEDRDAVVDFLRKTLGLPPRPKPEEAGAEEGERDDVGEGGASVEAGVAVTASASDASAGTPVTDASTPATATVDASADASTPVTAPADASTDASTSTTAPAGASSSSAPAAAVDDAESTPAESAE